MSWKLGCHPFPRLKVQLKGPAALTSNCGHFSRRNKEGSSPKARRVKPICNKETASWCDLHIPCNKRSLEGRRQAAQDGTAVGRTQRLHVGQPEFPNQSGLVTLLRAAGGVRSFWVMF